MNLIVEQPVKNFHTTIGHLRRKEKISTLLYATMRDIQLEIGTSEPFYELNPDVYTYTTKNTRWMYAWTMSKEFDMKIQIAKFWTPTPTYYDDKNIMTTAVNDPTYAGKRKYKLTSINRCRLYQEAIYISDLIIPNTTIVKRNFLDGTEKHNHPLLTFPSIRKPTSLEWREWKSFIFRNVLCGA